MEWLPLNETDRQQYTVLRLYAPGNEKVFLEFNPLKMSGQPEWNPVYEEWHCYPFPLRIYRQDYQLLLAYFAQIYPTADAFDGTPEESFDVCFDNWIGKADWERIIRAIEADMERHTDKEKAFLRAFLDWLHEALLHTDIIVAEGNL